jgi:CheY-like chemotaxis protein
MEPDEVFEHDLLEMLNHLYDPVYRPPDLLWKTLGVNRDSGLQALRDVVIDGIEALKPGPQVPLTARSWRVYGMLRFRFVEDLPQEVTAERLGITARHLRRNFAEAIHALSLVLLERTGGAQEAARQEAARQEAVRQEAARSEAARQDEALHGDDAAYVPGDAIEHPSAALADSAFREAETSWHRQLVRELEALEETAAGAVSNIAETVSSVLRLATHLTRQRGIVLAADPISPRFMAAIHPSALRQILISVIDQLIKQMESGEIRLSAASGDGEVQIRLSGAPLSAASLDNFEGISEMLSSFNIAAAVSLRESSFQLSLTLLQVDRCVLVVDDNMDMAHLYRRYLAGTRYYLQHVSRGEKTFEAIEQYHPDLIVLDVMLPDIDGWDLLTRLHENPETRPLPVMICSVMREKELAQALGASHYLTKPVQRQDFIRALDMVLQHG